MDCIVIIVFSSPPLQSSRHTPYEVMFKHKAVLLVDLNSQKSYDSDETLKAFNEAPLPDSADTEASPGDINV